MPERNILGSICSPKRFFGNWFNNIDQMLEVQAYVNIHRSSIRVFSRQKLLLNDLLSQHQTRQSSLPSK
jgi:hypothetical protein